MDVSYLRLAAEPVRDQPNTDEEGSCNGSESARAGSISSALHPSLGSAGGRTSWASDYTFEQRGRAVGCPKMSCCRLEVGVFVFGFFLCSVLNYFTGPWISPFAAHGWAFHTDDSPRHTRPLRGGYPAASVEHHVELPIGRIRGVAEGLDGVHSAIMGLNFYGVPYGTAGRFEAPEAAKPWHPRILDATKPGPSCARPDADGASEDCLYLNVFTPPPTAGNSEQLHPVLIWLHGGSFVYGSASDTLPSNVRELLLSNRMVIVSVEYRLGVLGFLASKRLQQQTIESFGGSLTGNWGILDQQLAMRWVHKHIEHFGGDPFRVGLIGWSAGAASVSVHLTLPSSKGLFTHAVMLSGGFTGWSAFNLDLQEQTYDKALEGTECAADPQCQREGPPCRCLLKLDVWKLVEVNSVATWAPTVDGSFLPIHPQHALLRNSVHKGVPIIIGSALEDSFVDLGANANENDFVKYLGQLVRKDSLEEARRLYMSPKFIEALRSESKSPLHQGWSPAYWAARRAYADSVLTCPARRTAMAWQAGTTAPAYWYLWDVATRSVPEPVQIKNKTSTSFHMGTCWPCPGAGHGSDQVYLFQMDPASMRASAEWLSTAYPALIADFVRSSNPNIWNGFHLQQEGGRAWPSAESGSGMWFQANASSTFDNLRKEVCDFWDAQTHG